MSRRILPFYRPKHRRFRKNAVPYGVMLAMILLALFYAGMMPPADDAPADAPATPVMTEISCARPYIFDGDTLRCHKVRVRLASIDAPEMPGHCREGRRCVSGDPHAAKNHLKTLVQGGIICAISEYDHYGRAIARCRNKQHDLSCAMVASGHAVQRYGTLNCRDQL